MVQTVQNSIEILQAQFVGKVFTPVVCNDSELVVQTVQETVEVPQLQCFDGVDGAAGMQRKVPAVLASTTVEGPQLQCIKVFMS